MAEPNLGGLAGSSNASLGAGQTAQKYARDMLTNYWRPAQQAARGIRTDMEAAARAASVIGQQMGKINLSEFDRPDGITGSRVMARPTFSVSSAGVATPLSTSTAVARFSGGGALARRPSGLGLAQFSTPGPSAMQNGFMGAAFGGSQRALPPGYNGWHTGMQPYGGSGGGIVPYGGGNGQIMPYGNQGGGGDYGSGGGGGNRFGKVAMGAGALGAGVIAMAATFGSKKQGDAYLRDLIANTTAGYTGRPVTYTGHNVGSFSGATSVSDMVGAQSNLLNMGFLPGSAGYARQAAGTSGLANQFGIGATAATNIQNNILSGQVSNRARAMLGINTRNSDGTVKDVNVLGKEILQRLGPKNASKAQIAYSLQNGHALDYDLDQLGLDPETKSALIKSMMGVRTPGKAYKSAIETAQAKQDKDAKAEESFVQGIQTFNKAVHDFNDVIGKMFDWIPGLKQATGFLQGLTGGGGGKLVKGAEGLLGAAAGARTLFKVGKGAAGLLGRLGSTAGKVGGAVGGAGEDLFNGATGWVPPGLFNKIFQNDPSSRSYIGNQQAMGGSGPAYTGSDGAGQSSPGGGAGLGAGPSGSAAVSIARKYLGVPYKWGGNEPGGFDCSGLVRYVYQQLGISLPRTADLQSRAGTPVASLSAAQPGDLLFWFNGSGKAHHVAIYIGNGMMIAAPHTGLNVQVQRVYGNPRIRRVLGNNNTINNKNSNSLGGGGSTGGQANDVTGHGGGGSAAASALGVLNSAMSTSSTGVVGGGGSAGDALAGALSGGYASSSATYGMGGGGSTGMGTGGGASMPPTAAGKGGSNVALAQSMAAAMGWKGAEWNALYAVWNQESGFKTNNGRPGAAYGIPQADPGNKMSSAGADWMTNPKTQIRWGLDYIHGRYGDPLAALAHKHNTDTNLGHSGGMDQPGGYYAQGSYEIGQDQDARVHAGEMIIPAVQAAGVRSALRKGGGSGGNVIYLTINVQSLTNTEMSRAITELKASMAHDGVAASLRNK